MEPTKRITLLLILVLLTISPGQSEEEPAGKTSNTRTANCLVKITCDPAILPPDSRAISYLVHSSSVGGKAAREVLGFSTDDTAGLFTIEFLQLSSSIDGPAPIVLRTQGAKAEQQGAEREDYMMEEYMMMEKMRKDEYVPYPGPAAKSSESRIRSRYGTERRRRQAPSTRREPSTKPVSSVEEQTCLFSLNIDLPENVKPAAREFLSALIENLRHVLDESYDAYVDELRSQFKFAEHRRDLAEAQLAETTSQVEIKVTPPIEPPMADVIIHDRLEAVVDLSNLTQPMSFEEVVVELEKAVDPPLQIQPNWKDLLEKADIEPTTPALMDLLTGVKLRKALELLLDGLSSDKVRLGYVVDEGVIVIATKDGLPRKMVTHVYEIPALAHSQGSARGLVQTIQKSVEPDSWLGHGELGEGTISVSMGNKLAIYQTYEVHKKIKKFLESMTKNIPASTPSQVPPEMFLSEKRDLLREKQGIEMEIARLEARQEAIEKQIVQIKDQVEAKIQPDPVIDELQKLIAMHTEQLALAEKLYETGRSAGKEISEIKEKLARARIDLAKRRQQLSLSAGGDRMQKYNAELADITIELAERTAALNILKEQLGRTENQLAAATMVDPKVSRIRTAARAFERADQRVDELNARLVNLRPPTLSIIGSE